MKLLKLFPLILALLLLPFGLKADTWYEMTDDTTKLVVADFGGGLWSSDVDTISTHSFWNNPSAPDSTTHYVIGQDTIITGPRIACDTVGHNEYTVRDTLITEYKVKCDTIYTVTLRPRWAPLVTVKLDSVLYWKLLEILNH